MEAISTGENSAVELQEYNGTFSLIACRTYQGKHYQQWGRLEMGKDKKLSDKSQPFKVILGNKETAVGVLKMLLSELGDVPF
jgi:hypothetical protein